MYECGSYNKVKPQGGTKIPKFMEKAQRSVKRLLSQSQNILQTIAQELIYFVNWEIKPS